MFLRHLWLRDFRCYDELDLELGPGCTLVVGSNGQGKTSLLEAIGWMATASSFRGVADTALVRSGHDEAIVRVEVVHDQDRTVLVEAAIRAFGRNRVMVNRQALTRRADLGDAVRVTVFAPDDLELVKGGPAQRREYLDALLTASLPSFRPLHAEYERIVKQRNARLRFGVRSAEERTTLDVLNDRLVAAGSEMVRHRLAMAAQLEPAIESSYESLAGTAPGFSTDYAPGWTEEVIAAASVEDSMRAALEALGRREIDRGLSLVGPHRDDWEIRLHGLDARRHASQGEQRTLALALRLAGHGVVAGAVGSAPVLLLDDVFSELDGERSAALIANLPRAQTIVTTAGAAPSGIQADVRLRVASGKVLPDA